MNILVINGPNLNLLGVREPEKYGDMSLEKINEQLSTVANDLGVCIKFEQSNNETTIVELIQQSIGMFDGIILNAAAYTHTSIAIRDAILATGIPTVEVHLSNIYKREEFRHKSFLADVCIGQITGFKDYSYTLALFALIKHLSK